MDRIVGGVLGLAAFVAVVSLGLGKGMTFTGSVARGLVALILGYVVGRLIFGSPGLSIVREAAGDVPPAPAPGKTKPGDEPASGGTPTSKAS